MCLYIFPDLFRRFPYLQLGRNSSEVIRLYRLSNKALLRKDDFPFASCLVGYVMVSQKGRYCNGWLTLNILSPDGLHCFLWCVRYWSNWGWHACWWQKYLMLEMRSGHQIYPSLFFGLDFLRISCEVSSLQKVDLHFRWMWSSTPNLLPFKKCGSTKNVPGSKGPHLFPMNFLKIDDSPIQ